MGLTFNLAVEETVMGLNVESTVEKPSGDYERLRNKPRINDREIIGDFELLASDSTYLNEEHEDVSNVDEALTKLFTKVYYVAPKVNSFSCVPSSGNREIGSTIPNVDFSWSLNKNVKAQSLTDCTISEADRSAKYNKPISANKTFTLKVTDEVDATASASLSFGFYPNVYYGCDFKPTVIDNSFVLGLSDKVLKTSRGGNYTINVTSGKYGWWCSPKSYGIPKCVIGGFETELVLEDTISLTNASGYTQDYYVYRTPNAGLGNVQLVIS